MVLHIKKCESWLLLIKNKFVDRRADFTLLFASLIYWARLICRPMVSMTVVQVSHTCSSIWFWTAVNCVTYCLRSQDNCFYQWYTCIWDESYHCLINFAEREFIINVLLYYHCSMWPQLACNNCILFEWLVSTSILYYPSLGSLSVSIEIERAKPSSL